MLVVVLVLIVGRLGVDKADQEGGMSVGASVGVYGCEAGHI